MIDSNGGIWKGFNKLDYNSNPTGKTICKVTYEAPVGSQIAVNFLKMDMQEPDGRGVECSDEYAELTEPEKTPYGAIG